MNPFCASAEARAAWKRWLERLDRLGIDVDLGGADGLLIGLLASREARLEEIGRSLAQGKGKSASLRQAERLAAGDMLKVLDVAERVFGSRAAAAAAPALAATGTAAATNVVPLRSGKPRTKTGQRVAAAIASSRFAVTRDQLRKRVSGRNDQLAAGIADALACGAIRRSGTGKKADPYLYTRGDGS